MEYVASSHSYTACPENFSEFYNQRRRWTPSTIANQRELLYNWKILLKYGNSNLVHIFYQLVMLGAGLVGPGSIFLLLVGGTNMVFGMGLWTAMSINLFLVAVYMFTSIFFNPTVQIIIAKVLSVLYGILMLVIMVILVIEAIRLSDQCQFSPSTVSLIIVVCAYLFAGILHFRQWKNLLYGVHYYFTIPCMYLFLPFYCIFNLTDTSWGTREAVGAGRSKPKSSNPWKQLVDEISDLREAVKNRNKDDTELVEASTQTTSNIEIENNSINRWTNVVNRIKQLEPGLKVVEDTCPQDGERWTAIRKKLMPLDPVEEETTKASIGKELESLKTNTLLMFLFINIAFIFTIFLMQVKFEEFTRFSVDWPLCKVGVPINMNPLTTVVPELSTTTTPTQMIKESDFGGNARATDGSNDTEVKYFRLDPINLVFMVFFIGVMAFQICGMIFHRIRNVGHLLAKIPWAMPNRNNNRNENQNQNHHTTFREIEEPHAHSQPERANNISDAGKIEAGLTKNSHNVRRPQVATSQHVAELPTMQGHVSEQPITAFEEDGHKMSSVRVSRTQHVTAFEEQEEKLPNMRVSRQQHFDLVEDQEHKTIVVLTGEDVADHNTIPPINPPSSSSSSLSSLSSDSSSSDSSKASSRAASRKSSRASSRASQRPGGDGAWGKSTGGREEVYRGEKAIVRVRYSQKPETEV